MRLSVVVACVGLAASVSHAQIVWNNPAGGLFTDGANWVGGVAPGTGDTVLFDLAGPYTITFDQDVETSIVNIDSENVTFDLGGNTFTSQTAFPDNSLYIAGGSDASLTVLNGTLAHNRIVLGGVNSPPFGTTPSLTLGAGSVINDPSTLIWMNARQDFVTLDINDGAQINAGSISQASWGGAHAVTTITGATTSVTLDSNFEVARFGTGEATISGGADFIGSISTGSSNVSDPTVSADLHITGADTTADLENFLVHRFADNDVLIDDGASVSVSDSFTVAYDVGSFVVSGADTRLTSNSLFGLRLGGTGAERATMLIENGATFDMTPNNHTQIGINNGFRGELILDGAGTTWNNFQRTPIQEARSIYVGGNFGSGDGIVRIRNGAAAMTEGAVFIGDTAGSTGLVELTGAGSRWDIALGLTVGNLGDAELFLGNGTIVTAESASVGALGRITGDGGVLRLTGGLGIAPGGNAGGRGTLEGSVMNEGLITPGDPLGSLIITGAFTQTSTGSLQAQLGALRNGQSDMLEVMGSATLAGELGVELLAGYTPEVGDSFTILSALGGLGGTMFDTESLPMLSDGLSLDVVYNADSVQLKVVPAPSSLALFGLGVFAARRRR